ncbi:hypothetical protein DES53_11528 [Roseimicrobium gellanilyticum]|uniref:Uncharacterized protein n=1 Tax=Roseimicrobium gellanilyticum TaxID=748857 RepID=A0A366H650_9BACT|nr:hypothetical protein [Roseimicrobium gellanilyticum]RBP36887.1 hypothetical protein DES53_11528 [Roseimicrobium gellanilyticum]
MSSRKVKEARPLWPLRCPPELSGDFSQLDAKRINAMIEDWLERGLREAMPDSVLSFFFTGLRSQDSRLQTNVRMIVRNGSQHSQLVGRFAWMVAYNIANSASMLQHVFRCDDNVGRSAIVLSADRPPGNFACADASSLAYVWLNAEWHPTTPLDRESFAFDGWKVPILEEAASTVTWRDDIIVPSAKVIHFGDRAITRDLRRIAVSGVKSPDYRARVWPLLETAQVLMVMAPAFTMEGKHRIMLGGCGLNLLIKRHHTISRDVIETALKMARKLDSLFGTVLHLHQAQERRKNTFHALNAIAHSLKNRSDRLSAHHPKCAEDLYIQKIAAQGAGQMVAEPSYVYQDNGGETRWRQAGYDERSLTESLRATTWLSCPQYQLALDPLENRLADARWVTLIEELMENLRKWSEPGNDIGLKVVQEGGSDYATLTVRSTVWEEQWERIRDKVRHIADEAPEVQFKGLNTVLWMLQRLADTRTAVVYECGTTSPGRHPKDEPLHIGTLPITLRVHEEFTNQHEPLSLTLTVHYLPLPP